MPEAYLNYAGNQTFGSDLPGWNTQHVIASAAGNVTVKNAPGLVAEINAITASVGVSLYDGARQVWPAVTAADKVFSPAPLACGTNITLNFSAAGEAWIVYR